MKIVKPRYRAVAPMGLKIERIRAGAAELERVATRERIDNAADEIAGTEGERVAAAGELDCSTAGADDGAGLLPRVPGISEDKLDFIEGHYKEVGASKVEAQ